jgi:subtilisin family serine protease
MPGGFLIPKESTVNPSTQINANRFVPGELLVKLRSNEVTKLRSNEVTKLRNLNEKFGLKKAEKVFKKQIPNSKFETSNIYKFIFPKDVDVLELVQKYSQHPNVEWAEPNYIRKIAIIPDDTNWSLQWALPKIEAPTAWDITTGTAQTVIAVIDTGVDWDHPDLASQIWQNTDEVLDGSDTDGNGYVDDIRGYDFVSVTADVVYPGEDYAPRDNDPMDFHGHGTHVSGIVASQTNNSLGVAGTCWNCKIMAVRAGYKGTDGNGYLEDADCAAAIEYATDNGADIINMSWGDSVSASVIQTAVNYAYSAGVLLVGAAGNQNVSSQFYPAAYSNVIAVAAVDQNDQKASYSNYGSWVDVSAPGGDGGGEGRIYSTFFDDSYAYSIGTSMASPHVAGLAALLKSFRPSWTHDQLRAKILEKADNIDSLNPDYEGLLGSGRINAYQTFDPPSCSISSPAASNWYGGMITVAATAMDNSSVAQVAFEYSTDSTNGQDGTWFSVSGSPDLISPYALAWQTEPQTGVDPSVWLRCQAKDNEEIYSPYDIQEIKVDNELPTGATATEYSHSVNAWSNDNTIEVLWSGADDGSGSGIAGYSYQWTTQTATLPDETVDTTAASLTSTALVDSDSWYFHLRTADSAGNWTTIAAHLGPFKIDTLVPTDPALTSTSHVVNVWSNDNTIDFTWSGAQGTGSEVAGYSYFWTTNPASVPNDTIDTSEEAVTSPPLIDSDDWYFHLRTADQAGNWTSTVHLGPFKIDTAVPSKPATPNVTPGVNQVSLSWTANPETDVENYEIWRSFSEIGGYTLIATTSQINYTDTTANAGATYYYKIRAIDRANNISDYSDASQGAFPSSGGGGYVPPPDTTPPTNTSVLINDGAEKTDSVNVNLTLQATGASWMMISNNPDFIGAIWETYTTSKSWTLTSGEGTKRVYVKFKDSAGNISEKVFDEIQLMTESQEPVTKEKESSKVERRRVSYKRDLAKEQEFVRKWQGFDGRLPTPREIQVGVYGIGRDLAAEIAFVKAWKGKGGRLPTWKEIIAGVYYKATKQRSYKATKQKGFKRDLAKEQEFVRNWRGLGGRLPTPREIQVGVYGIGRDLAAEIAFVKAWKGKGGRLPTWKEIIAGVYYKATKQRSYKATKQKGFKRDLAKEQEFVRNWRGLGGRLPTPREIQVGVYGIGRDLKAEQTFVRNWEGRFGRLPTRNEIIAGVYYEAAR